MRNDKLAKKKNENRRKKKRNKKEKKKSDTDWHWYVIRNKKVSKENISFVLPWEGFQI